MLGMKRCAVVIACMAGACAPIDREAARQDALALRPAGEPVDCISISGIRRSEVIDDRTIDFHMAGGRVLRNHLPNQCPGLGFDKAFAYSPGVSRLCAVDIITVVRQGGGRGASCGLGKFQPVERAP